MEMEKKNIAIIVLAIALVASGVGNIIFAVAGESIYGGDKEILRVWDSSTPRTLDPVSSWDSQSNAIIDQVTEGLFWVDIVSPEGPDESLEVIPKLAESYSWDSTDTILTITLREGVYFHDGELCDADAVVTSLERLMFLTNQTGTLEDADQLAYTESLYHFSDLAKTPMMKKVTAVDDYELTIELNRPFGAFIPLLAYTSSNIVSPNTPQEVLLDLTEDTLVGTGPFVFEYYRVETEVRFSRFANWWGGILWNGDAPVEGVPYYGPSIGGPYYDEMVYIYYEDSSTGSSAMLAGDVDAGGVISEDLQTAIDDPDLTYKEWGTGLAYYYVAFQGDKSSDNFVELHWRRALSHAINYTYITEEVLAGRAVKVNSCVPSAFPGYLDLGDEAVVYDIDKARSILQDAGIGTGLTTDAEWQAADLKEMTFTRYAGSRFNELLYTLLSENWLDLGVTLTPDVMEWSDFITVGHESPEDLEVWQVGWAPDYLDAFNMINPLFGELGGSNWVGLDSTNSPDVQTWLSELSEETDPAERINLAHKIQERLFSAETGLLVQAPLFSSKLSYVHGAHLQDYPYNVMHNTYFATVWPSAA